MGDPSLGNFTFPKPQSECQDSSAFEEERFRIAYMENQRINAILSGYVQNSSLQAHPIAKNGSLIQT